MSRHAVRASDVALVWALVALSGASANANSFVSERTVQQLAHAVKTSRALSDDAVPYNAVFRRDPMQPLVDERGQWISSSGFGSRLSVQGIIWSDQQPFAVVDDELYASGATVGPYTIIEIQKLGIVVQQGDSRLFIPLDRGFETDQDDRSLPDTASTTSPQSLPAPATRPTESAESAR